jgi:hypothetical protein
MVSRLDKKSITATIKLAVFFSPRIAVSSILLLPLVYTAAEILLQVAKICDQGTPGGWACAG